MDRDSFISTTWDASGSGSGTKRQRQNQAVADDRPPSAKRWYDAEDDALEDRIDSLPLRQRIPSIEDRLDSVPLRQRIPSGGCRKLSTAGEDWGPGEGGACLDEEDLPLSARVSLIRSRSLSSGGRRSSMGSRGEVCITGSGGQRRSANAPCFGGESLGIWEKRGSGGSGGGWPSLSPGGFVPSVDGRGLPGGDAAVASSVEFPKLGGGHVGDGATLRPSWDAVLGDAGASGGDGAFRACMPESRATIQMDSLSGLDEAASAAHEEGGFWATAFGWEEQTAGKRDGGPSGPPRPLTEEPQPSAQRPGATHHCCSLVADTPSSYQECPPQARLIGSDRDVGPDLMGSAVRDIDGCGGLPSVVLGTTPGGGLDLSVAGDCPVVPKVSPMLPKHLSFASPSSVLWPSKGGADPTGGCASERSRRLPQNQPYQGSISAPAYVQLGHEHAIESSNASKEESEMDHVTRRSSDAVYEGFRFPASHTLHAHPPSHPHSNKATESLWPVMPVVSTAQIRQGTDTGESLGIFDFFQRGRHCPEFAAMPPSPRVWPHTQKVESATVIGAVHEAKAVFRLPAAVQPSFPISEAGPLPLGEADGGQRPNGPDGVITFPAETRADVVPSVPTGLRPPACHTIEDGAFKCHEEGIPASTSSMPVKRCVPIMHLQLPFSIGPCFKKLPICAACP